MFVSTLSHLHGAPVLGIRPIPVPVFLFAPTVSAVPAPAPTGSLVLAKAPLCQAILGRRRRSQYSLVQRLITVRSEGGDVGGDGRSRHARPHVATNCESPSASPSASLSRTPGVRPSLEIANPPSSGLLYKVFLGGAEALQPVSVRSRENARKCVR